MNRTIVIKIEVEDLDEEEFPTSNDIVTQLQNDLTDIGQATARVTLVSEEEK